MCSFDVLKEVIVELDLLCFVIRERGDEALFRSQCLRLLRLRLAILRLAYVEGNGIPSTPVCRL